MIYDSGVSSGTKVREAKAGDTAAMAELAAKSDTAAHWKDEDYDRIFKRGSPERTAFIAEEQDRVVGLIVATCVEGEWEIENVVVDPNRQRCGLGNALVRALLARADEEGAEAVFLEVRESNRAARGLYERHGFVEVGRRKGYYSGPAEDAVVYRKTGLRAKSGEVK